jgi:hypothetical protein
MAQAATSSNFTTVDASGGYYVNGTQVINSSGTVIGVVTPGDLTLAQNHILVGNASSVGADVAMSGDVAIVSSGATTIQPGVVTRAKLSAPASLKTIQTTLGTIATTGTFTGYCRVPSTGTLATVGFVAASNLAANDTNYITFTCTNVTQSKTLFANDATENTKATGGTAITADGLRYFTLTGTTADLNVTAGDLIKIVATVTGTLANAVNSVTYSIDFNGTT